MIGEHLQHAMLADLVTRKLGKHGVRVTARQRQRILRWLKEGAKGEPPLPRTKTGAKDVTISFTPRDERRLKGQLTRQLPTLTSDMTTKVAARMARPALRILKGEWLKEAGLEDWLLLGFEQRLARTWKKPFELLELQRYLACSTAAEINDELRRRSSKSKEAPLVEALTSLHARACQISAEVLVLLRKGYPEAAIARWRSLHEVSIVMHFIHKHGVETAKRYLDHDFVESWRGAKDYATHCADLGFEPIAAEELAQVKQTYDAAIKKHGSDFKDPYGWAAWDLKLKRVAFDDVARGAGFAHWRPLYRLASHPVHANPKSVKWRLGVMDGGPRCLPVGPSNYGLADPGQNTGLSLAQVTALMIEKAPTFERLLVMYVMKELAGQIAHAFVDVQRRIERREVKLRAKTQDKSP
jgi:hypothetical protein